jgi:uncharacterized membrane protein
MKQRRYLISGAVVMMAMIFILTGIGNLNTGRSQHGLSTAMPRQDDGDDVNTTYSPGTIEWKVDLSKGKSGYVGTPSVADLDGDGYVETLLVGNSYSKDWWEDDMNFSSELFCLDHQGNTRWTFLLSNFWFWAQSTPIICDLEGDGELDILIGGETRMWPETEGVLYCLDKDANIKWQVNYSASWSYYTPALGDLDGDNKLEIIYSTWNQVVCLDHLGEEKWSVQGSWMADFGFSPTIADLHNDGKYEVLVESWEGLYCFEGDPSDGIDEGVVNSDVFTDTSGGYDLLWERSLSGDFWSRWWMDSTAVADIRGDGKQEILTAGIDGSLVCLNDNGRTVWETEITGMQSSPVIGDEDGDGKEDILALVYWSDWWDDWEYDENIDSTVENDGQVKTRQNDDDNKTDPDDPWPYREEFSLYCFNGLDGSVKWSYPLPWWGEVLILGDVDGDMDLEIFMSSEEKILALEGDENGNGEIDDEEVLWQFHSGWIWGWANSFALADVDHDGQLELLATANEVIYCLSVGGKCAKGTIEWGKVYFDLANTNHYISGIQSGVKVYPKDGLEGQKRTMIKYGEPGEIVDFEMRVKNIGSYDAYYGPSGGVEFEDIFKVNAMNLPSGWWATFDKEEIKLAPQEVAELTMSVQVPYSAYSKSSANIQVMVWAKNSPKINDTQETVTIVKGMYNLKLTCPDPIKGDSVPSDDEGLTPGDTTLFRITITNLGSANDTAVFTLDGPQGWNVTSNIPTPEGIPAINLGSLESRDFFVFAQIPKDAGGGDHLINLTAQSQGDTEISDTLVLTVRVNAFGASIYLFCNESVKYVKPGNEVQYEVEILNMRNGPVVVNLEHTYSLATFNVTTNLSEITVGPGKSGFYTVISKAPPDALADVLCSIQLSASDKTDPRIYDTLTLWTVVEHVYDLSFSISNTNLSIMPEATFTVYLNTTNLGNGYDHYSLDIGGVPGTWGREMSKMPSTLDARILTHEEILLNVTVPRRTATGTYPIDITCTSEDGKTIERTLGVFVEEYLEVTADITPQKKAGGPGRLLYFNVLITNLGNGRQPYTVGVLDPQGFDFENLDMIYLEPFENMTIGLTGEVPMSVLLKEYNFTVGLSSVNDAEVWNVTDFQIEVTSPDLTVGEVSIESKGVKEGDVVSVRTKVVNLGNAPAENVTLAVYEKGGDKPLATQDFDVVYETQEVYLQWIQEGEETEYIIKADPDNTVIEINENNNYRDFSIKSEFKRTTERSVAEILLIITLVCAGLLLAIGAYTAYIRRKEL